MTGRNWAKRASRPTRILQTRLYSDAYEKMAKRASELENKPLDDDFLVSSFKALYDPKGQGIESATDC